MMSLFLSSLFCLLFASPGSSLVFSKTTVSRLVDLQHDLSKEYMYACSTIQKSDIPRRRAFYCCDHIEPTIFDHICSRAGLYDSPLSKWVYGEETIILDPHKHHVRHFCDPSVVRGVFSLDGRVYSYLMTFTFTVDDLGRGLNNRIGVALSDDLDHWVVHSDPKSLEPIPLVNETEAGVWGVGQPSMVLFNTSVILLSYTRGNSHGTAMHWQRFDMSDVAHPRILTPESLITKSGLYDTSLHPLSTLFNGAISYDPSHNLFFLLHSGLPFPSTSPSFIANYVQVAFMVLEEEGELMNRLSTGEWKVIDNVSVGNFNRTHNARWITNERGERIDGGLVEYGVSVAMQESFDLSLWTYRVMMIRSEVVSGFDYWTYKPGFIKPRKVWL